MPNCNIVLLGYGECASGTKHVYGTANSSHERVPKQRAKDVRFAIFAEWLSETAEAQLEDLLRKEFKNELRR